MKINPRKMLAAAAVCAALVMSPVGVSAATAAPVGSSVGAQAGAVGSAHNWATPAAMLADLKASPRVPTAGAVCWTYYENPWWCNLFGTNPHSNCSGGKWVARCRLI